MRCRFGFLGPFVNKGRGVSACNRPEEGRPNPGEVEPDREWELKVMATRKKWPWRQQESREGAMLC